MPHELVLGVPREGDHLHKYTIVTPAGDHELKTLVCLQRDCYAEGGLSKASYPPGIIGPKRFWLKRDQDQ